MCHTSPLTTSKLSWILRKKDPADLGGAVKAIALPAKSQGAGNRTDETDRVLVIGDW